MIALWNGLAFCSPAPNSSIHSRIVPLNDALLLAGELPDLKRLREEFAPRQVALPQVTVLIPAASCYDALLPSAHEPPAVAA